MQILIGIDPGREYAPAQRNPSDNGHGSRGGFGSAIRDEA
jgi:hypothetical protein